MKRAHIFLMVLIVLTNGSCDCDNDCGSYTSKKFLLQNNLTGFATVKFFHQNSVEESTVKANETIELFQISVVSQGGFLQAEPYFETGSYYDSVKYLVNGVPSKTYLKNKCTDKGNPLCKDYYELIKDETDKKGNRFIEYRIVVE